MFIYLNILDNNLTEFVFIPELPVALYLYVCIFIFPNSYFLNENKC